MHVEDSSKKLSAIDEVLLRAVAKSGRVSTETASNTLTYTYLLRSLKRGCKIVTPRDLHGTLQQQSVFAESWSTQSFCVRGTVGKHDGVEKS